MTTTRRTRQAAATREVIVTEARTLFAERGYGGTSIDDILERAGVARGALYHHFDSKQAVFEAVYQQVHDEIVNRVLGAALAAGEPWAGVRQGLATFLDACLEPDFRRIVVLDSVSVLQHQQWEGGAEPADVAMLRQVVAPLLAAAGLPGIEAEPLVFVALGGLYGAALFIARSPDPVAARAEVDAVLDTIITALVAGDVD